MTTLNNCPMCGSPAKIDSTGTAEAYGHAWQTLSIECMDTMGAHCGMDVTLSADMSDLDDAWNRAIEFWNSLPRKE